MSIVETTSNELSLAKAASFSPLASSARAASIA
jgi:hypothetical protein